ncbi:chloride channel protein [Piscinibacter sp.]|uniref:chloride channel protein n=1 Tax=Piscinibacter sp. TaxID=1903157 RepID=UPI001B7C2B3A|nr:chloride channel protein [Piscinibacter sp.]MBK7533551.1 chloride channel protein [Piscinibacter sp.]MBL0093492.1 chloride channel protein [Piscinibacter sp.]MBP6540964.1 chloride channel protein [Piscinibacter sp.]HPG78211.1 chloride channel protein [Piscinibacter sp.]
MNHDLRIVAAFKRELSDWRLWVARAVVIAVAIAAGLTVVAFTWMTEHALGLFRVARTAWWWLPLIVTPIITGAIVWVVRRHVPGAAGSGIPQVMAALDPRVDSSSRGLFVSLRLTLAKMALTSAGLLGGLSLGREGPSVQVAAGVMLAARRWLPQRSAVTEQGLLVAGGAAGIAAAFNTPLGGVMFAIEELSRSPEQRNSGLIIAAIVLAGLVAVSLFGNGTYFGVIQVPALDVSLLGPGVLVALAGGIAGGLFSRLLITSLTGRSPDVASRWRARRPVLFAMACGLAVAVIGVATGGATFGSGYTYTRNLLEGAESTPVLHVALKFLATWLTAWSGVPGGIFAPALTIGASLGHDVATLTGSAHAPALIALGMAAFLAAATQAPLTAFIIVMEMVDGHAMVLSLMACALVASGLSRLISRPLYATLARAQLERLPERAATPSAGPVPEPGKGAPTGLH